MSGRAHFFTALGPLPGGAKASLGVEMQGSGRPALPVVMVWVPEAISSNPVRLAELEAQTASALRIESPNVIRVRGLEKLDEGWARIVEFADAEPLSRLLELGREKVDLLWPAIAAALVADACLGVHHAHEAGEASDSQRPQLHGGLRPGVLLVDYKGRTKVTGYGAAIFAPAQGSTARDAYTAPEQVLGGREAMTRQTDVYALGAVLYECLAGVPPFTAEEGLLETLILTKAPSAHRISDWPELAEIALRALSKKASDRFPTALAMREAIVASASAPPVSQEVVARWANLLIPPDSPERKARRELVAGALATTGGVELPEGLLGELGAGSEAPAPAIPSGLVASTSALEPPPALVVSAPAQSTVARPRTRPTPPVISEQTAVPSGSGRSLAMGLGMGIVLAGGFAWYRHTHRTPEVAAPVALAAPVADAGPATPDAGELALAPLTPDDGGAGPVDGGWNMTPRYVLDLATDPPLDLRVDGDRVGSGAAHVTLTAGKHRIEAGSRALRIAVARDVDLQRNHQRESFSIGQGQLAFDVPTGATVTVDGKLIGTAPVSPVKLYVGTHDAVVEFNGAETDQRVPIHADYTMTLTVHAN